MAAMKGVTQLDDIYHAMGDLKMFTICQILVMTLSGFPSAFQLLSNVFTCVNVPHQCATGPNDSSELLSSLDWHGHNNLTISYRQCEIVVSYNNTVLKKEKCIYGMVYDKPIHTSVLSQFDLVCEYSSLGSLSQTLLIAGQGVGAIICTILSDRFGRKPILDVSNAGLLACGLAIAYAPNYTVFALFKFAVGGFQQGCAMCISTLITEMLTTKNRRLQACSTGIIWGVSCMTLPLFAYCFRHYSSRTLQMAMSLCSLTFVFQLWYLKESLRWMIANGKSKAVMDYIQCATKQNKTSFQQTLQAYEEACHLSQKEKEDNCLLETSGSGTATKKLTLLDLLKIKRLLVNAAIMWLAWFTTAMAYFAIYLTSTSLAGNSYLNFFLTALMEIPNNFILYSLLNRCGRKVTLITVFLIVSTGVILSGVFNSLERTTINSALALAFSCVAMTGASSAFNFVYLYTTELFPTNMRNQALGVSSLMGRVGGMIAPFTGIMSEKAKWAPGALIGCLAFFICLLSMFLPETRGRELPQTIEDVKSWFSKKKEHGEANCTNDEKGVSLVI